MESSFLQKLKKGMEIEKDIEEKEKEEEGGGGGGEKEEETKEKKVKAKKPKKAKSVSVEPEIEETTQVKTQVKNEEKWPETEGQLAIDVYQTESELVIQSAIAGVKPKELDVTVEGDLLIIRGERKNPAEEGGDYFSRECYWGPFSREIILPVEVDPNRVEATLKEGILTIKIPKLLKERRRKIMIKGTGSIDKLS